ncbi:MAG: HAD family hydrolase [Gaiellaceae bacterium]
MAVQRRALDLVPHPLVGRDVARGLLRLPREITACVFAIDGVLIAAASVHSAAWTRTLDEFLERRADEAHWPVLRFDPQADYWTLIHGKPRLDGVKAFLASRGVTLPLGTPDDPPGAETVNGLANRKVEVLQRLLAEQGPRAYEDSRHFLELARDAHLHTAVHSSSTHTATVLERAGLSTLVDVRVDGRVIVAERLRGRPSPDRILAACRKLGVEPGHVAAFETRVAGIAAARAAGCRLVVGVERSEHRSHAGALEAEGADLVVSSLGELVA